MNNKIARLEIVNQDLLNALVSARDLLVDILHNHSEDMHCATESAISEQIEKINAVIAKAEGEGL